MLKLSFIFNRISFDAKLLAGRFKLSPTKAYVGCICNSILSLLCFCAEDYLFLSGSRLRESSSRKVLPLSQALF
jgi:hypothetical protein